MLEIVAVVLAFRCPWFWPQVFWPRFGSKFLSLALFFLYIFGFGLEHKVLDNITGSNSSSSDVLCRLEGC